MRRKIQQAMFVWVCELQIPKPEHGCNIKTDFFFGWQIDTPVGQVVIFLMVKKKLKKRMLDCVKNLCFSI